MWYSLAFDVEIYTSTGRRIIISFKFHSNKPVKTLAILHYLPTMSNSTLPTPSSLSIETLRERILTGGGTGATRGSLSKVATRYSEFLQSLSSASNTTNDSNDNNDNNTSIQSAAAALETELSLHDLEIRKLLLSSQASDYNSSQYTQTLHNMQNTLKTTQADIQSLTSTLVNERQIKSNRAEYNALAKLANDQKLNPVRITQNELNQIEEEINIVQKEVKDVQYELCVKEKLMRCFMSSLGDLTSMFKEEEIRKKKKSVMEGSSSKSDECKKGDDMKVDQGRSLKRKRDDNDKGGDVSDDIGAL